MPTLRAHDTLVNSSRSDLLQILFLETFTATAWAHENDGDYATPLLCEQGKSRQGVLVDPDENVFFLAGAGFVSLPGEKIFVS